MLGLGEVHAGGGCCAGTHRDPVLDHVALHAGHGCMGPAGAVGVLVLDRGNVAVVTAVVLGGQVVDRLAGVEVVDARPFSAKVGVRQGVGARVGRGSVAIEGLVLLRLLGVLVSGKARRREEAQGHDCRQQKGCQTFGEQFHSDSPFHSAFLGIHGRLVPIKRTSRPISIPPWIVFFQSLFQNM